MERGRKPRMAGRLRGIADAALQMLQTRLELLAVEVQEEKLRLTRLAINIVLCGLLLGFGLVFLMVFLTVLFWEEHRLLALGLSTAICLGGALFAATNVAREFKQGSRLFAASLAELARDREALRAPDDDA
ncbi:phage holin family protein [Thauera sp.]|uniref:phage holin family protein n=1 Tax=Thauera sp. TaxID=1905334 RepID=UPI0039E48213